MATKASGEDVNAAFRKGVEGNLALISHTFAIMTAKILPIHDAWIVDSGCAQHVCNNVSKFIKLDKYHGPLLKSVNTSLIPSRIGTVNVLCSVRDRRRWIMLDHVLLIPSTHINLISIVQLLK
jgi:hypothetical protein